MKRRATIIVDRLGQHDAERLAAIVGGTRLHVPGDPRNRGRLASLLGDDLALLVIFHFGDSRFYVPTLAKTQGIDLRKLKRLANRGWSSARIARELKCSERTVDAKRAQFRSRARINVSMSDD